MRTKLPRLAAALLAAASASGVPTGASAARLGWELGVAGGYGDNLFLSAEPADRLGAPQLAGRVGVLSLWSLSDRLAAWAHGGYDVWIPIGYTSAASHGLTAGAGAVWLATERLSFDLAPMAVVRLYPGGLEPAVLMGASASAELTLTRRLSASLTGYYLQRLSADPSMATAAAGAGPGLAWRPSQRVRISLEYGLETGDPSIEGQTTGTSGGLIGGSSGKPTHRVRVRLRVRLGDGVFLEPDYRFVRGATWDSGGAPAPYVAHTARMGLVWRR